MPPGGWNIMPLNTASQQINGKKLNAWCDECKNTQNLELLCVLERPVLCKPLLHNLLSDGQDWKEFCCHDINIKTNVCKHLVSTSSWFFHQNILSCLEHALLLDLMDVKGMTSSCWGIRIIKHFHFCRSKNFTHNRMGARQHFCCIVNIFKRLAYNKRLHTPSYTILLLLHAMKLIQLQGVQCNGSSNSLIRISSGIGN